MALSTLANTTWVLNDRLTYPSWDDVSFTVNLPRLGATNESINLVSTGTADNWALLEYNYYEDDVYHSISGWSVNGLNEIEFISGADITNATFIAWIEANAIRVRDGAKFIQISGEKHDINDIRIYTGETSPDNNSDLTDSVNGDIYFKKGYGIKSDDNWKYEIKNGICECWRTVNLSSIAFGGRWGNLLYAVDGIVSSKAYPVTFKSLPRATVSAVCRGSNTVWVYTLNPGSVSASPSWSLAALYGNTNSTDITVHIHVVGIVE